MLPRIFILFCYLLFAGFSKAQDSAYSEIEGLNKTLDSAIAHNSFADIDLKEITESYHRHFHSKPLPSLQLLKNGLEISFHIRDTSHTVYFYSLMGNLYRDLGLTTKAMESHLQAEKYAGDINKVDMLTYIQSDIGNIHFDRHEYDQALVRYRKGIEYSKNLEDRKPIAVCYNNVGLVFEKRGIIDSALYFHKKALTERQKVGSSYLVAHSYNYIAEDYFLLGNKEKTNEYFNKSIEILQESKRWTDLADVYRSRGQLYLKAENWITAIKDLSQALEWYKEEKQLISAIETEFLLAKVYIGMEDMAMAENMAKSGLYIATEKSLLKKKIDGHHLLAKIYAQQNDFDKAYQQNLIYSQLTDTFWQEEMDRKVSILSYQSELDDLNDQLEKSELTNKLSQDRLSAIEARNNALIAVTVIAILLVLLFILLFYFKAKNNKKLRAKSEIIQEQKAYIESQNAELRKSKELAESYSEAKTNFVSHISHEIRTPMNAIIGLTQLLIEKGNLKDEDKRLVNSIRFSSKKLLNIINDVLDFSKIEAGKIKFEEDDFNVRKLTDELINTFQGKNEKRIEIESYISSDVPNFIRGDSTRLYQILNNLMGNAIKFTDDGYVRLKVYCKKRDDNEVRLKFEVEDSGRGMSKDKRDQIFEAYNQGEDLTYKKYGGTGLGLTITRNLIELQGGVINVESEEGEGSTFTFEIPYKHADTKMHVTKKSEDAGKLTQKMEKDLNGMRILYVEDNEVNQFLAQQILKSWNVQLEFADDGEEALQKLSESKFDIVLMDIQMPVMNGIEATQEIRKGNIMEAIDVPIIGFTADVMTKTKVEAIDAGMNDVMVKPFDKDLLYEMIESYAS